MKLRVINLQEARYECTYGRGCDGICCREGRPPVYPEEVEKLNANLDRLIPLMRPEAQSVLRRLGYLTQRTRQGLHKLRNSGGWCIFFNQGCILHRLGAQEGDYTRYKPYICAVFPLDVDHDGQLFIRQKGYKGEKWDLFCLDPASSPVMAKKSLKAELALARRYNEGDE